MTQNKKLGFTLIELLVVISVLGIIAAFIVARLSSTDKIARDMRRKSDLNQYRLALENYSVNSGGAYPIRYPSIGGTNVICGSGLALEKYMVDCPGDPRAPTAFYWYRYLTNITGVNYILWAKLEKSSSSFWYVCSNGVVKEKTSDPVITDCGF